MNSRYDHPENRCAMITDESTGSFEVLKLLSCLDGGGEILLAFT
jgi:hypothetical protein